MKRPTYISEEACLQHYLPLLLRQFMRSEFILVAYHLYKQIMIYISGLITSHGGIQDGTSFANQVLILTEEKIQSAAACQTEHMNNPEASRHTSTSGLFFRKIETSCSAIDHSSAIAKYNKCLVFSMCARYGIPGIFFCCKNIPCTKESQLSPFAVPATLTPNNDAVLHGASLMIISWITLSIPQSSPYSY